MDHGPYGNAPHAAALRASIQRRGLACIYHYTPADQLQSIFQHGAIFCRRRLTALGIPYRGHGWGYAGKEQEMQEYIVCGFCPHWGMIRGETRPIAVIELDGSLIWRAGTIFCPGNSASNEYDIATLEAADPVTTFESLFPDNRSSWPTNYQAEVLVRDAIGLKYFRHLIFSHNEHQSYYIPKARAGLRANPNPELYQPIRVTVDLSKFPPGFNPQFNPGDDP